MKKDKLLELLKYIKEKDLIKKYNDIYKEYDENKEIKNPGFKLQDLYSLTDEEVDLIISSKHDVEALFRLRMHSVHYKHLIKHEVKLDDNVILKTIEDFRTFDDYDEYDREKKIIEILIKQDMQGAYKSIYSIIYFLNNMANKKELSDTNLTIDNLCYYLCCIAKCKTVKSANLLSSLASSSKERTECGFHKYQIDESYELKVVDKISECDKNFQADCISTLLRMRDSIPSHNAVLLNNIGNDTRKIKVIDLFTKVKNEDAGIRMLEILKEDTEKLRTKPDIVISMLEECTALKSNEDYVNITAITEIDDLENALLNIDENIEIDASIKVKVKKKK